MDWLAAHPWAIRLTDESRTNIFMARTTDQNTSWISDNSCLLISVLLVITVILFKTPPALRCVQHCPSAQTVLVYDGTQKWWSDSRYLFHLRPSSVDRIVHISYHLHQRWASKRHTIPLLSDYYNPANSSGFAHPDSPPFQNLPLCASCCVSMRQTRNHI